MRHCEGQGVAEEQVGKEVAVHEAKVKAIALKVAMAMRMGWQWMRN